MVLELCKQITVHLRDVCLSTAQPHSEVKDRTKRSFDRERAVTQGETLLDELVEELPQRLLAELVTDLERKEGAEAGSIMLSRSGHLDAVSNDNGDKIIPSSA